MKLTLTPDEIEWARGLWAIGYDTLAIARRVRDAGDAPGGALLPVASLLLWFGAITAGRYDRFNLNLSRQPMGSSATSGGWS